MINYDDILSVAYLDKQYFRGSHFGMRYLLRHSEDHIEAIHWPEPFSFDKTPDEKKTSKLFLYTEEGRRAAIDWLNECWESIYKN